MKKITHLERHLTKEICGKLSAIEACKVKKAEDHRVKRLSTQMCEMASIEAKYGEHWPLIANALIDVEIPIYIGPKKGLTSHADLQEYMAGRQLQFAETQKVMVEPLAISATQSSTEPTIGPSLSTESDDTQVEEDSYAETATAKRKHLRVALVDVTRDTRRAGALLSAKGADEQEPGTSASPQQATTGHRDTGRQDSDSQDNENETEQPLKRRKIGNIETDQEVDEEPRHFRKRRMIRVIVDEDDEDVEEHHDDEVQDQTYDPTKEKKSDSEDEEPTVPQKRKPAKRPTKKSAKTNDQDRPQPSDSDTDDEDDKEEDRRLHSDVFLKQNYIFYTKAEKKWAMANSKYIKSMYNKLTVEKKEPKTIANSVGTSLRIMKFFSPNHMIDQFQPQHLADTDAVNRFFSTLQKSKLLPQTQLHYTKHFKHFLRGIINMNEICFQQKELKERLEYVEGTLKTIVAGITKTNEKYQAEKQAVKARMPDNSVQRYEQYKKDVKVLEEKTADLVEDITNSRAKKVKPKMIKQITSFFLALGVRGGHRPGVVTGMSLKEYKRAKKADPINVQGVGPCHYLVTPKHKSGGKTPAYFFFTEAQFTLLKKYVKNIRVPFRGDENEDEPLFTNNSGKTIGNPSNDLRALEEENEMDVFLSNDARHCVETVSFNYMDKKTQLAISRHLCHDDATAVGNYVDSGLNCAIMAMSAFESISTAQLASSSQIPQPASSSQIPQPGPSTEMPGTSSDGASTNMQAASRPSSPLSDASSSGSSAVNTADVRVVQRREAFIKSCFEPITADSDRLPTKKEFKQMLKEHPEYGIDEAELDHFQTQCQKMRNEARADKVLKDLGRTKLRDPENDIRTILQERGWLNVKTLKRARTLYEKRQAPELKRKASPTQSTISASRVKKLDDKHVKNVKNQSWVLAEIKNFGGGKGKGVVAAKHISQGSVVCDYHGDVLPYDEGQAKYEAEDTANNCYMLKVDFGGEVKYIDANPEHCSCHPKTNLKGRLLNHSKSKQNINLTPKLYEYEGRPVVLFVATRDIEEGDELLWNYNCQNDPQSSQQEWMKT